MDDAVESAMIYINIIKRFIDLLLIHVPEFSPPIQKLIYELLFCFLDTLSIKLEHIYMRTKLYMGFQKKLKTHLCAVLNIKVGYGIK